MAFHASQLIPSPDVILFDIDDTLYDSIAPHGKALAAVVGEVCSLFNLRSHNVMKQYQNCRQRVKVDLDGTASSHSRLLYIQKTLETLNSETNSKANVALHSLRIEAIYWDTFLKLMEPAPGLHQLMAKISSLQIKMGIVTDLTATIQLRKLLRLGVSRYFQYIVTSEEAGADKPNFNAFSLARDKCEGFRSRATYWMVGDSPTKDLLGAKSELLATTFLVPSRGIQVSPGLDYVDFYLPSLSSLADYL
jgi:HAD superfamily hydrolase (TIGR01549 family)